MDAPPFFRHVRQHWQWWMPRSSSIRNDLRLSMRKVIPALAVLLVTASAFLALRQPEASSGRTDPALVDITLLVDSVRATSYPQLKDEQITLREMHSDHIYFESRFTFTSFFFSPRLHYIISYNPEATAKQIPADGLRAIVAHELAHIDYYAKQRRMGLIGLTRLASAPFAARFERSADLEAISLGYGPGLASFRTWLYRNIPAAWMDEKKRDYFSPEEIDAILTAARQSPQIMGKFTACVPRNLTEIQAEANAPDAPCPAGQ